MREYDINRIMEVISKAPERFEKGRTFNIFVIETTVADIRNKIEKIKKVEIEKNNLLHVPFYLPIDFI